MNPSNCADCNNRIIALNKAIVSWALTKSTTNAPITVVDQYTGFNTATDTHDGDHPTDPGNVKISGKWLGPLKTAIRSVGGGSSPSDPSDPTTITTTAHAPGQTAPVWGQCGGNGGTGATVCADGSTCAVQNGWYSQYLPN